MLKKNIIFFILLKKKNQIRISKNSFEIIVSNIKFKKNKTP